MHAPDIAQSHRLLDKQRHKFSSFKEVLDLGGGNGRVSKEVLLKRFENVDLSDYSTKQLAGARKNVPQIREFINVGI